MDVADGTRRRSSLIGRKEEFIREFTRRHPRDDDDEMIIFHKRQLIFWEYLQLYS
jgi:hypothetical protein